MKKILITGASGFIGANFTRRLVKKKKNVSILIRRKSNLWRIKDIISKVDKHVVDLENYSELNKVIEKIKPNIIFHLASYGVYPFEKNIETLVLSSKPILIPSFGQKIQKKSKKKQTSKEKTLRT